MSPTNQTLSTEIIPIQSTICCGPGQAFPAQSPLQTLSLAPECGWGRGTAAFEFHFFQRHQLQLPSDLLRALPKKGQSQSTPREEKPFVESSVAQANTCLAIANSRPSPFTEPYYRREPSMFSETGILTVTVPFHSWENGSSEMFCIAHAPQL